MALDIAGALIESSNDALKITASSKIGLNFNSSGFANLANRPYFIAYGNSAWNTFNANVFNVITLGFTYVNNGSHYNTTTGRFTAPISGAYYFTSSTYGYKNPSSNADSYTHPMFVVNGTYGVRMASQVESYRLRGRTNTANTFSWDLQINEILNLVAGDFVQLYIYCNGTQQWYGDQTHFTGTYLG